MVKPQILVDLDFCSSNQFGIIYQTFHFLEIKWNQHSFLDVADNTGDGFSYVILPVQSYKDIPTNTQPITLVRSVI